MMRRYAAGWWVPCLATWALSGIGAAPAAEAVKPDLASLADEVKAHLDKDLGKLSDVYKYLHAHPELSLAEVRTSARLARELREVGFVVTEKVGGHGVVGILENGKGPTVMIRADMDALPIVEQTGLPYASKEQVRGPDGNVVGVMHACGHDIHMTCWLGTARALVALKDRWKGRVLFVAQPAEERGQGARNMLKDGLFERFPKPDFALALHCDSMLPYGQIGYTEGMALANVDSVDITIHGMGGHGSAPHTAIDPIVIAARFVLDVQTLVSREIDPLDSAVVTVGSIHGGTKHNIIPPEVKLQLTVRSFKAETRQHLLSGIERIAVAAAAAARAPKPTVKVDQTDFTPATFNHPDLARRSAQAMGVVLGSENVLKKLPVMGGEDFGRYGDAGVPSFIFWLGTVSPEKVKAARAGGTPLPSLHSDKFYPEYGPSIKTGVLAMATSALNLLER